MAVNPDADTEPRGTALKSTSAPRRSASRPRTSPLRKRIDQLGRWIVSVGGLLVIASVLGILLFIFAEVRPLLSGARVTVNPIEKPSFPTASVVTGDEYRTVAVALSSDGRLYYSRQPMGNAIPLGPTAAAEPQAADAALPLSPLAIAPNSPVFIGGTRDGRVLAARLRWDNSYVGANRTTTPALARQALLPADPLKRPLKLVSADLSDDGGAVAAVQLHDNQLVFLRRRVETHAISGETQETIERHPFGADESLRMLLVESGGRQIIGGTASGNLILWPVRDGIPGPPQHFTAGPSAITALSFLVGQRALIVGQADGTLSIWFPKRLRDGSLGLQRIRDFRVFSNPVRRIAPSPRNRSFLALAEGGKLGLFHSTSHRVLWVGDSPLTEACSLVFNPKADGALVAGPEGVAGLTIDNPHPEISLSALFGKVWYEGYDRPQWVWQSSSASDDFEPKLSLVPLFVGTLKGTFYSLFLAIPLGVLGAMYTSQFMHYRLKKIVKPTVEIMAALPSVVLGFLAGLWLAPRVERYFPGILLLLLLLPAAALFSGYCFNRLPSRWRNHLPSGSEAVWAIAFLAAAIWFSTLLSDPLGTALFGGHFQSWLSSVFHLPYDQRNAVVVGLAMGFAVIPIIFSVAEEAFSNVPRGLVAGSLALGANRWQTVTQVVLPSASPGIFSAIMIGFGRAVGETMIVLMATGNTPIMDWNPFNGFRSFSANIAVEIPEAPQAGTLYRTLFLSGLLLFVLTFLVNTAAEIVRNNLRRRYSNL